MTKPLSPNVTGMLLVTAAMALFAIEDAIIKHLAADLPTGQILILLGLGGTLVFLAMTLRRGDRFTRDVVLHPAVVIRVVAELLGTVFFVTSLALVPLNLVSAIIQVNPLLVTLGAAVFLGEAVGIRRWSAIFVGLAGVLIVLRPGASAFDPAVLFTVLGVIGLSARDVATRRCPDHASTFVLSTLGFGAVIPAGFILLTFGSSWVSPNPTHIGLLVLAVAIGVVAYYAITAAMRVGEVSAVTPFRYTRLIFGVATGIIFFSEHLDMWTIVGSLIVVSSGLYLLWRERLVG